MDALAQKLAPMVGTVCAIALLSGCSTAQQIASREGADTPSRLTGAPARSSLAREQVVDGQKRCFYKDQNGEFFTAVKPAESCSTQFTHQGEQWDAVNRRF
ncbi:MAG TPA: hypothetical protein VKY80_04950 [Croceibacterium sp.]|nr:hypothetical protein [Croceibacterium sp.]